MIHTTKKYGSKKCDVFHFDDLMDYLEVAEHGKIVVPQETRSSHKTDMGKGWSGTETFEEALKIAREGWPEGRNKALSLSSTLFDKISTLIEKPDLIYDVEGNDYDLGLYLKGEPECWMKYQTQVVEGQGTKIIKLVFNTATSAGVSSRIMIAKGAAIAALTELLEYSGRRVELIECTRQSTELEWYVPLKFADQPLDIDRIIFALAHPANYRRIGFSIMEQSEQMKKAGHTGDGWGGYGMPMNIDEHGGDIYIPCSLYGESQWESIENTKIWLLEQLHKQGVPIERV